MVSTIVKIYIDSTIPYSFVDNTLVYKGKRKKPTNWGKILANVYKKVCLSKDKFISYLIIFSKNSLTTPSPPFLVSWMILGILFIFSKAFIGQAAIPTLLNNSKQLISSPM